MQSRLPACIGTWMLLASVTPALATPFLVTLDPGTSSVTAEVCINVGSYSACDSDGSPVSGTLYMDIDDKGVPTEILLYDFDWDIDQQLDILIDFGLAGDVTATGSNITISDASAAVDGPAGVSGGSFDFGAVPAQTGGTVAYNVPALLCALMPPETLCQATIDLATFAASDMPLDGSISVGGSPSVTLTPSLTMDVIPDSPGMVTMEISGTLNGTGAYIEVPTTSKYATFGLGGLVIMTGLLIITRRGTMA